MREKHIKKIPEEVVSKIAAGEVVERPVSVVKELVENALDAGASHIKIDIFKSGTKRIEVTDDGHGMSKENLMKSFLPHTTSKLKTEKDLHALYSYGFRGEALASMAAVARVTIRSRGVGEESGTEVALFNSEVKLTRSVGMPQGTTVIVEELFASVPVRKKFLSAPRTEAKKIIEMVTYFALAHPHIGFVLNHNGKNIIQVPKGQSFLERTDRILGGHLTTNLMPVSFSDHDYKIMGFVGTPEIAFKSRTVRQYIFVNGRPIKQREFTKTIRGAYDTLLDPHRNPVFIIFIQVPPSELDINIHPRKETVRFHRHRQVMKLLEFAVKRALDEHDLTFRNNPVIREYQLKENVWYLNDSGMALHTAEVLRQQIVPWDMRKQRFDEKYILQIHDLYLIVETEHGVLLVDQHAAHERILYEQFLEAFTDARISTPSFAFEEAIVFELPAAEAATLEAHLETFAKLGFEIEPFGGLSFKVNSVPDIYRDRNIPILIGEVLHDIVVNDGSGKKVDEATKRTISYLACRTAIKAGDPLSQDERRDLIKKLLQTKTKYTCPHGRPAMIELTKAELERMFRRR